MKHSCFTWTCASQQGHIHEEVSASSFSAVAQRTYKKSSLSVASFKCMIISNTVLLSFVDKLTLSCFGFALLLLGFFF